MTDERSRWDAIVDGDVAIPVNNRLGFAHTTEGDPKTAITFSWTVPGEFANSAGNLQGGVLAAFADALMGGATSAHLPADSYPALAEMKLSIFRPVAAGARLTGKGYVLKAGRRVIFAEAEISDADGVVAKASGTEVPARG